MAQTEGVRTPHADVRGYMAELGLKARRAARELARAPTEAKNRALMATARLP